MKRINLQRFGLLCLFALSQALKLFCGSMYFGMMTDQSKFSLRGRPSLTHDFALDWVLAKNLKRRHRRPHQSPFAAVKSTNGSNTHPFHPKRRAAVAQQAGPHLALRWG